METKMVNLKINNMPVTVPEGTTILDAANSIGIKIPTLCYLRDINAIGACRICVVEVVKARTLVAACVFPVSEGMEVFTNSKRVLEARKTTLELLLSNHDQDCLSCSRNQNCELQKLSIQYGCDGHRFEGVKEHYPIDTTSSYLVRDNNKCILCRRCVAACNKYQSVSVIGPNARGFYTHIGCAFENNIKDVPCVACGQCINVCPVGALHEREEIDDVLNALADPTKYVIVGTAPAVRFGLGEEFGSPIGTNVTGKMVAALRRLGFKNVFDVDFTADLTIMEEGTEFLGRVKNGGKLPMITSCSPAWIKFIEHNYPEQLGNLSSCKSPQGMFGALAKSYYAQKLGIDPKDMYVVSAMPCTAKKFEKDRPELTSKDGYKEIDAILTTRELAKLIKRAGLIFNELPEEEYDAPFGIGTGAGVIFGVTGGVMEAALRTVVWKLTGENDNAPIDFNDVRGTAGIKEATYTLPIDGKPTEVKVAVASGLANARVLMDQIKAGTSPYAFIEIMSCPGGCVNGGGQPIKDAYTRNYVDVKATRINSVYNTDAKMALRQSHANPAIIELYKEFLGEPNSHKAHELLHTTYTARKNY